MTENTVSGRYFPPGSSRYSLAVLTVKDTGFNVQDPDGAVLEYGPLRSLELAADVAGLPDRIMFPSGGMFETDDAETFQRVFGQSGAGLIKSRWQGNISKTRWAVIFLLSLAVPPIAWFGYPIMADSIARSLPQSVDSVIGGSVLEQMDGTVFEETSLSEARQVEIRSLFEEVRAASGIEEDRTRLLFRSSKAFGANALAFPDGTVLILDDLVSLSEHDDEIAAVLAHEIAHVLERHAIRRITRALGISVLVTVVLGDTSSLLEEAAALGVGLFELSYSREFELEADRVAGEIMIRTGRDPDRLIDLLRRISEGCGDACEESSIFSTHPGMRDRMEALDHAH